MVRSLLDRADNLVTEDEDKEAERLHVRKVLANNGYKHRMLKAPRKPKPKEPSQERAKITRSYPIPYVYGLAENLAKIYRKYGISTHFKPYNTVRSMLVRPKDKSPDEKKCGIIYQLECENCEQCYVGETARSFETRLKEHYKNQG